MRFLADMGVSMRVVEWLRASGHDAIHLRDEGLQKLPNGEIFQRAIRQERVVLTFDLDFGEIVAASGGTSIGAILFRLRNTRLTSWSSASRRSWINRRRSWRRGPWSWSKMGGIGCAGCPSANDRTCQSPRSVKDARKARICAHDADYSIASSARRALPSVQPSARIRWCAPISSSTGC
jgi:predicted nuclease of predicted toxin-antitoxin system